MRQPGQALKRFREMTDDEKMRRLERSGISVRWLDESTADFAIGYAVQIHQLRGLEIRRRALEGSTKVSTYDLSELDSQSPLYVRMERLAVRALYTLGLDSGEVVLTPLGERNCQIRQVLAQPWLNDRRLATLYEVAAREEDAPGEELSAERGSARLLIGMDPEFVLVRMPEGRVVPASRYLGRLGIAGCDAVTRRGRTLYPVAELRPAPSEDPARLLRHLRQAFATAARRIDDRTLIWQAGGMPQPGFPLGGHLHFSGVPLNGALLRALDNYLALPLALLEDKRSARRRPHYGILGDFRRQSYGGFEYRTLPSFLISPQLAKGVIGMAFLIASQYSRLQRRPLGEEEAHRAFYEGNQVVLREYMEPVILDMVSLEIYSQYETYIAPLLDSLRQGKQWDETRDLRPYWKLS
ncbi:Phage phiEco32-like COOH.NH2 ligase-type 2 [Paenibacillus polymyxa]|nr:Phage phiEco32-like COOH.NH2 ligase-type 2 [Paenibacillus polymyxa]